MIWFQRRTVWEPGKIRDALTTSVNRGLGTLQECAAALRELVEHPDKYQPTDSPHRLHAHPNGGWWVGVRERQSRAATTERAAAARCARRGHEHQPADGCVACVGEANACPHCPRGARRCDHGDPPTPESGKSAVGRAGERWLPKHLARSVEDRAAVAS